jgi:hypothetical protein
MLSDSSMALRSALLSVVYDVNGKIVVALDPGSVITRCR